MVSGFILGTSFKLHGADVKKTAPNLVEYRLIGVKDWKLLQISLYKQEIIQTGVLDISSNNTINL
jgi:hypothetical protein